MMTAQPKDARLEARLPRDVHALLKRAADLQGRSLTDFVISSAREAAYRAIGEAEIIELSAADQCAFVEALINPPEPTPAMQRAKDRHERLIGPL